jgi:hypothetical protein
MVKMLPDLRILTQPRHRSQRVQNGSLKDYKIIVKQTSFSPSLETGTTTPMPASANGNQPVFEAIREIKGTREGDLSVPIGEHLSVLATRYL